MKRIFLLLFQFLSIFFFCDNKLNVSMYAFNLFVGVWEYLSCRRQIDKNRFFLNTQHMDTQLLKIIVISGFFFTLYSKQKGTKNKDNKTEKCIYFYFYTWIWSIIRHACVCDVNKLSRDLSIFVVYSFVSTAIRSFSFKNVLCKIEKKKNKIVHNLARQQLIKYFCFSFVRTERSWSVFFFLL